MSYGALLLPINFHNEDVSAVKGSSMSKRFNGPVTVDGVGVVAETLVYTAELTLGPTMKEV